MRFGLLALLALLLVAACAAPADEEPTEASGDALTNDVLHAALVAGQIGETPTGYLGIVDPAKATDELERNVADNTIKRRAVYTKVAENLVWTTVQSVAQRTAYDVYARNILVGYAYKTEDGTWTKRTASAPVVMPSFCPPSP